jgi:hypothetical protein
MLATNVRPRGFVIRIITNRIRRRRSPGESTAFRALAFPRGGCAYRCVDHWGPGRTGLSTHACRSGIATPSWPSRCGRTPLSQGPPTVAGCGSSGRPDGRAYLEQYTFRMRRQAMRPNPEPADGPGGRSWARRARHITVGVPPSRTRLAILVRKEIPVCVELRPRVARRVPVRRRFVLPSRPVG